MLPVGKIAFAFFGSLKSISIFAIDSNEFKIPSLSKSKSKLSMIPSLSLSVGHILTICSVEI